MDFCPVWYVCSFCRKTFQHKPSLLKHRRAMHMNEIRAKKRPIRLDSSDDEENVIVVPRSKFERKTKIKKLNKMTMTDNKVDMEYSSNINSAKTNGKDSIDEPPSKKDSKCEDKLFNCKKCKSKFSSLTQLASHMYCGQEGRNVKNDEILRRSVIVKRSSNCSVERETQDMEDVTLAFITSESRPENLLAKSKSKSIENIVKFLKSSLDQKFHF